MSTHQVSKPRAAKKSITEESARPGTCRSKVGCEAIDEPCTNKIRPAGPDGSPPCLFQRNRRTSPPFSVQCSSPRMAATDESGLFMLATPLVAANAVQPRSFGLYAVGSDDFGPFIDLGLHVSAELIGGHRHRSCALLLPCLPHVRAHEDFVDL